MLTDTHCHLYLNFFGEDLSAVLERAWEKGLTRILIPGIDLATSQQAVTMCEQDPRLFAAVGVHPNDCLGWSDETIAELRHLAANPRVVAIGEIGLDYYREHAPHDLQQHVLQSQLDLAAELDLPVILHNRSSWDDLWPMIRNWQEGLAEHEAALAVRPGVLHSFDGSLDQAMTAIEHHFRIGISGPVTFKNAVERQKLTAGLPLDTLLTETDAPYLAPQPFRGRRNEPAYIPFISDKIAELHHLTPELLAAIMYKNAALLFRWDTFD